MYSMKYYFKFLLLFIFTLVFNLNLIIVQCNEAVIAFNPPSIVTRQCTLRFIFLKHNKVTENQITTFLESKSSTLAENSILLEAEPEWIVRKLEFDSTYTSEIHKKKLLCSKFIQCYEIIIFQDPLISSYSNYDDKEYLQNYFYNILSVPVVFWRNENPTAVIFVTNEPKFEKLYSDLHAVKITSTYLLLYNNQLSLICEICSQFFYPLENSDLSNLDRIWHKVHSKGGISLWLRGFTGNYKWNIGNPKICDHSWKRRFLKAFELYSIPNFVKLFTKEL